MLGLVVLGMDVDSAEYLPFGMKQHHLHTRARLCSLRVRWTWRLRQWRCAAGVELQGGVGWLCFAAWACAVWCWRSGRHAMRRARVAGAKLVVERGRQCGRQVVLTRSGVQTVDAAECVRHEPHSANES